MVLQRGLPLAVAVAQLVGAAAWENGVQVYSASCGAEGNNPPSCSVVTGEDASAQAAATWQDGIHENGWGRLVVKTPSSEPGVHAFAAGYIEGYLTAERVNQHYNNSFVGAKWDPQPAGMVKFMETMDQWWAQERQAKGQPDAYWKATSFLSDQLDGLVAGVNAGLKGERSFSRTELLLLNSFWDLGDVQKAVDMNARANFESMSADVLNLYEVLHGHCSAIVKLLPDGSELYTGHNTWFEYYHLLRVFKRYEFGSWAPVAMSSYPGMLSSSDDFYQVGHMLVMETTIGMYNNDLYDLVKPESLPFWIRVMTAHRLATNGSDWMEIMQKHNSGTYNNMWMVVDYSLFTPGQELVPGTFTVGEQIPGYFHYEDQTWTLAYGYWPSYNKARYPETVRRVKQDVKEKKHGTSFGYQLTERAQIFRRDQGTIKSEEDMQRIMRYNKFQTDPIAKGQPSNQLANRMDLIPDPAHRVAFGAIDAKYTTKAHNEKGEVVIVAGPTHDDQPVFDWSEVPGMAAITPHRGQPDRFDFGWMTVDKDLAATPWATASKPAGTLVMAIGGAVAVSVAAMMVAFKRRGPETLHTLPDDSYTKMSGAFSPNKRSALEGSPASTACPPSGKTWPSSSASPMPSV